MPVSTSVYVTETFSPKYTLKINLTHSSQSTRELPYSSVWYGHTVTHITKKKKVLQINVKVNI
jgi:hypothetical protein